VYANIAGSGNLWVRLHELWMQRREDIGLSVGWTESDWDTKAYTGWSTTTSATRGRADTVSGIKTNS
jgi:hypothetical protein